MTPRENHLTVKAQAFRRTLAKLREPLTSLYVRAYLLKRRLRRELDHESLNDLSAIRQDAQEMETRMQELEEMVEALEPPQEDDPRR